MQKQLQIYLEIICWVATLIIAYLVMKPILDNFNMDYPFLVWNFVYIVCFITYTRYVFLLKHTFIAHWTNAKIFLFFLTIPYFFFGIESIINFKAYWHNDSITEVSTFLKTPLTELEKGELFDYIQTETMFFGMAALMSGFLMAGRMAVSLWRERHTDKV
jgi:hypothetical protein